MFTVFDLFFVLGFGIGLYHFHARTRRRMMVFKCLACLCVAVYYFGMGAQTALVAVLIAALGSTMQAMFPDHLLTKTRVLRAFIAATLAITGIVFCAGNASEALPLVAIIIARFSEVQVRQQSIRFGYVLASSCWIAYAFNIELMLLFFAENLSMLSNLTAIWNEEQKRKKAVPVLVMVS